MVVIVGFIYTDRLNAEALLMEDQKTEENLNVENIFASEGDFKVTHCNMNGLGVLDSAAKDSVWKTMV